MEQEWEDANGPNYITNTDLKYPYAELPYVGEYHLEKLPLDDELVEHVDYWGEGRIDTNGEISGFPDCYNVNCQYQLVRKGSDEGCKIPNRIPTIDEETCDTSSYIKNGSVKLVTLMDAPINESCASDIARIIQNEVGMVVVFGFKSDSADIRRLSTELSDVSVFRCPKYVLPDYLQGLTRFDTYIAYLNAPEIEEYLYNAITAWDIDTAVAITKSLHQSAGHFVIEKVVDKVLEQGIQSTMTFAYTLWESGEKAIVKKYFPDTFELIFNEDEIIIESHHYENAMLKLDSYADEWQNRLAWGNDDRSIFGTMFSWIMVPMWKEDKVFFHIKNYEYQMLLRLDIHDNSAGDRKCWGSHNIDDDRYNWKLIPMKLDDKVLFFIVNTQYTQPLKLDDYKGKNGDRQLWGTREYYTQNPEKFGWVVRSFYNN